LVNEYGSEAYQSKVTSAEGWEECRDDPDHAGRPPMEVVLEQGR
jgi:hypothetical protein